MATSPIRVALAALLAVAQLLAPFAHRPAAAVAAPWLDVCSSNGERRVPFDDGPQVPRHEADHCVLCRVATAPAGIPPQTLAAAPPPRSNSPHGPAPTFVTSGAVRFDAPARAPPAMA